MDADKVRTAIETARRLHSLNPKWTAFHAAIWGAAGELRTLFPNGVERREFETTAEHRELLRMLSELRGDDTNGGEFYRVVTVRLPPALHEVLKLEAHEAFASLNSLCIAKLIQPVEHVAASLPVRPAG